MTEIACARCDAPLQFRSPDRNPDARLLRKSKIPAGYCAACAMANWLQHTEPLKTILAKRCQAVARSETGKERYDEEGRRCFGGASPAAPARICRTYSRLNLAARAAAVSLVPSAVSSRMTRISVSYHLSYCARARVILRSPSVLTPLLCHN